MNKAESLIKSTVCIAIFMVNILIWYGIGDMALRLLIKLGWTHVINFNYMDKISLGVLLAYVTDNLNFIKGNTNDNN